MSPATAADRYFDWAATALPWPGLLVDCARRVEAIHANPSSAHAMGRAARDALDGARDRVAARLGVEASEVVFTSGTTEANNLVVLSFAGRPGKGSVLVDPPAHQALAGPVDALKAFGYTVSRLRVGPTGAVRTGDLARRLAPDTRLVALGHVQSETGVVNTISGLATESEAASNSAGHSRRPHFHVDGAQSLCVLARLSQARSDSYCFGAHKLGAPGGAGVLVLRRPLDLPFRGGKQEGGRRPGTENLLAAVLAAECLDLHLAEDVPGRLKGLGETLHAEMMDLSCARILPPPRRDGIGEYSPHILAVALPPVPGEVMARLLSDRGFMVAVGSACGGAAGAAVHLRRLGVEARLARCMIRISLGHASSHEGIRALARAISESYGEVAKVYGGPESGP